MLVLLRANADQWKLSGKFFFSPRNSATSVFAKKMLQGRNHA
jgi:hypothetical protein